MAGRHRVDPTLPIRDNRNLNAAHRLGHVACVDQRNGSLHLASLRQQRKSALAGDGASLAHAFGECAAGVGCLGSAGSIRA